MEWQADRNCKGAALCKNEIQAQILRGGEIKVEGG